MSVPDQAVEQVFARSDPPVRALAQDLLDRISVWPDVRIEPKASSIHVCRKSAFAGLHPRKSAMLLNVRSSAPIESDRVRKVEKVSANRFHNEFLLEPGAVPDAEMLAWLKEAADLAS